MRKFLSHFLFVLVLITAMLLPVSFCHAQTGDSTYTSVDTAVSEDDEEDTISTKGSEDVESDTEIEPVLRTISADTITAIKRSPDFFILLTWIVCLGLSRKPKKTSRLKKNGSQVFLFGSWVL